MKKILFCLLSFIMFFSVSNATVNDVSFVGGTGGSKILDLTHSDNKINTAGVIYDKDASLVYEITYTNDTNYNKKIADISAPNNKQLKYMIIDLDNNKVILPGETVKFKYSIYLEDDKSFDELQSLNESAELQLSLDSVIVNNPNTIDLFFVALFLIFLSLVCYKLFNTKKTFYGGFAIFLLISLFGRKELVLADEKEVLEINTNIKYILSNLAPSCANTNYTGDFCIDWKAYGNRDVVNYLVMEDTKSLPNTYTIGDVILTLQSTHDVSEQQNGDVNLGVYKVDDQESYLFLIGQDDGVVVPKDASYQFSSYDTENNNSTHDFKYVKYADFSKFYSNKTTNMSYMLTGIGTVSPIEKLDLSGFETSNVTDMSSMFLGVGEFTPEFTMDVSHFDTSNVTTMEGMFREVACNSKVVKLDLSNFNTSKVKSMKNMFNGLGTYAESIELHVEDFDTSNVTNMNYMFQNFGFSTDGLIIDYFKKWDTTNVVEMKSMLGATSTNDPLVSFTQTIDVTGLDTENVTTMAYMFAHRLGLKEVIGLESFDTSNVTDMKWMFAYIDPKKLDIENWDVSNVTNMLFMFSSTNGFEGCENGGYKLDLSKWNVSKLEVYRSIFNTSKIDFYIKGWELKNCDSLFSDYGAETLDLSYMNFGNSSSYKSMFNTIADTSPNWKIVEYPKVYDLSGSDWNEEADTTDMFLNVKGSTIYVKDEKAKAFIEAQAPDCTVLIKEK